MVLKVQKALIKILFLCSDMVAAVMATISLMLAVAMPFASYLYQEMVVGTEGAGVGISDIVKTSCASLILLFLSACFYYAQKYREEKRKNAIIALSIATIIILLYAIRTFMLMGMPVRVPLGALWPVFIHLLLLLMLWAPYIFLIVKSRLRA